MNYNFYWKYIERPKRIFESWRNRLLGWDNAVLIQRKANKHRYELVIDSERIVRLLGWTDQHKDDYYWVVQTENGIALLSCVGGFVWLKNRLQGFDYYQMLNIWDLNHPSPNDALDGKCIQLK